LVPQRWIKKKNYWWKHAKRPDGEELPVQKKSEDYSMAALYEGLWRK